MHQRINIPLTIITTIYVIINIKMYDGFKNTYGGGGLIYILYYPIFWGLTSILVLILARVKRKQWFSDEMKASTIVLLLICNPIPPFIIIASLTSLF